MQCDWILKNIKWIGIGGHGGRHHGHSIRTHWGLVVGSRANTTISWMKENLQCENLLNTRSKLRRRSSQFTDSQMRWGLDQMCRVHATVWLCEGTFFQDSVCNDTLWRKHLFKQTPNQMKAEKPLPPSGQWPGSAGSRYLHCDSAQCRQTGRSWWSATGAPAPGGASPPSGLELQCWPPDSRWPRPSSGPGSGFPVGEGAEWLRVKTVPQEVNLSKQEQTCVVKGVSFFLLMVLSSMVSGTERLISLLGKRVKKRFEADWWISMDEHQQHLHCNWLKPQTLQHNTSFSEVNVLYLLDIIVIYSK